MKLFRFSKVKIAELPTPEHGQVEYGDTGIHLTADVDSRLAAHIVAGAEDAASANRASHDTAGTASAGHSASGFAG